MEKEITEKRQKLAIIILERALAKKLTKTLNASGITYHAATSAMGTAPTDLQAYFGFGESEKSIVFCPLAEEKVQDLFTLLKDEFDLDEPNKGIAFTVPIVSMGTSVLEFLMHDPITL